MLNELIMSKGKDIKQGIYYKVLFQIKSRNKRIKMDHMSIIRKNIHKLNYRFLMKRSAEV